MTVPEILEQFRSAGSRFPREALEQAVAQRDTITPELLRILDSAAKDPKAFARDGDITGLVFALHLLAQFRETRAYRPTVRIASAPDQTPFELLGDTVGEALHRILASLHDGDSQPLKALVEDREADEFARAAALDAFLVLEHEGAVTRDSVVQYLRDLVAGRLERDPSFVWDALMEAVGLLQARDLLEAVDWIEEEGLNAHGILDVEEVAALCEALPEDEREDHRFITDAIAEMEWWACFQPEDGPLPEEALPDEPPLPPGAVVIPPGALPASQPAGRNDPCPCGSGRKYKKCCGA